jgi:TIR domain
VLLFLSYADEDKDIAQEIAERLSVRQVKVYPHVGHVNGALACCSSEGAIGQADAFLALLSPSFLTSSSCRRERELALHRERRRCTAGAGADFVQVLQVRATPYHEAGPLRDRPWFDMTTQQAKENALNDLISKFEPAVHASVGGDDGQCQQPADGTGEPADGDDQQPELPRFRNREQEIDKVVADLTGVDGHRFWLIIAPPQLGKSWFLDRIGREVQDREPGGWVVKRVDVRDQPPEVRHNAEALLGLMFGATVPSALDPDTLLKIAVDVRRVAKSHLCLLDSAELLDKKIVQTLRSYLSEIHRLVQTGNQNARLALLVASRREEWTGVSPKPRLRVLPLSWFKVEVMSEALRDLSSRMKLAVSPEILQQHAELVYRLSEGLPALLYEYLNWIDEQQWVDLERLKQKRHFDQLTKPYIEQELVSVASLFGPSAESADQQLDLEQAVRAVVPYRIFTPAHLHHHAEPGGPLHPVLKNLGWSVEELWTAICSTDLLYRPLKEPWQAIFAPIRRLLCRYWHPSDESLMNAHIEACKFVRSWVNAGMGSDQSVVLVECLWHKSQVLSLSRAANAEETLTRLARELSGNLVEASAYTPDALRQYAVRRMEDDDEILQALDELGVSFDRLADAIREGPADE